MKKIKVWLVDDEVELGELFVSCFENELVCINYYSSPANLISALEKDKPDIFFLDYRMPNINGDQLAGKLPPEIPKYLITGEIDLVPESKVQGVIVKPYDFSQITQILDKIQNNH